MNNQELLDGSNAYIASIKRWVAKFQDLMSAEMYAPTAIVAYYLPSQHTMIGCPLGDNEYQKIGEQMRTDYAAFAAAEKTGLLAEGIDSIFGAALDNCDNWAYYAKDIKYILKCAELCKYVRFCDRYVAEVLLSGGALYCDDEELWQRCCSTAQRKLSARKARGYAY